MKKLIVVTFGLLLSGCASPPPEIPTADSQAVGDAFRAWIDGWTGGDVEAVTGPMTADAVVYDPVGDFHGSEGVTSWAEGTFAAMSDITIAVTDASVSVAGPMAWVTGGYEWTATLEGETEPFTENGNLTMLWVLQEDGSYASPHFHASTDGEAEPVETPGG